MTYQGALFKILYYVGCGCSLGAQFASASPLWKHRHLLLREDEDTGKQVGNFLEALISARLLSWGLELHQIKFGFRCVVCRFARPVIRETEL